MSDWGEEEDTGKKEVCWAALKNGGYCPLQASRKCRRLHPQLKSEIRQWLQENKAVKDTEEYKSWASG